jgi:ubiquitin-like protein Pup
MAEREQKRRPAPREDEEIVADDPVVGERGEELKAEMDDLLDEIDEVLETNAEEFVKNYIQKGGE